MKRMKNCTCDCALANGLHRENRLEHYNCSKFEAMRHVVLRMCILMAVFVAVQAVSHAQKPVAKRDGTPLRGATSASFVPHGWVAWDSAHGDLNDDRLNDVALVIVKTDDPESAR